MRGDHVVHYLDAHGRETAYMKTVKEDSAVLTFQMARASLHENPSLLPEGTVAVELWRGNAMVERADAPL